MNESQKRFWQVQRRVDKEGAYLQDVAEKLFSVDTVTQPWLEMLIATPDGRDRLEAYVSKFSRMQDTLIDKLLPACLTAAGEKSGSAIDNLNRADRLGLLQDPDQWLAMRQLRNRLVHEYVEDRSELAAALNISRDMTADMLATVTIIRDFGLARFPQTAD